MGGVVSVKGHKGIGVMDRFIILMGVKFTSVYLGQNIKQGIFCIPRSFILCQCRRVTLSWKPQDCSK